MEKATDMKRTCEELGLLTAQAFEPQTCTNLVVTSILGNAFSISSHVSLTQLFVLLDKDLETSAAALRTLILTYNTNAE